MHRGVFHQCGSRINQMRFNKRCNIMKLNITKTTAIKAGIVNVSLQYRNS